MSATSIVRQRKFNYFEGKEKRMRESNQLVFVLQLYWLNVNKSFYEISHHTEPTFGFNFREYFFELAIKFPVPQSDWLVYLNAKM